MRRRDPENGQAEIPWGKKAKGSSGRKPLSVRDVYSLATAGLVPAHSQRSLLAMHSFYFALHLFPASSTAWGVEKITDSTDQSEQNKE
jgi:hypothetical protein